MEDSQKLRSRPHIFEIDLIRAITVFSVVAVHSLAFTSIFTPHVLSIPYSFFEHLLHYNREMFMFVTGLVLTYVYFHRQFSIRKFWLKRFLLVFIPYVLWTVIYVLFNNHNLSVFEYIRRMLISTLNGDASFQLYYILLTLQFYAIFPVFLIFMKKVSHKPWLTLFVSFVLQFIFIFLDFHYLQNGLFKNVPAVRNFIHYQDRVVVIYQFFFILGGFAAIYMDQAQKFVTKFKKVIPVLFIAAIGLFGIYFYYEIEFSKLSVENASSVLQPSVVIYSIAMIVVFSYLAIEWAKKKKLYSLVSIIADTSFGIYFVHVLILGYVMRLVPLFLGSAPFIIKDVFVLFVSFSISTIICYMLLKIPLLSWTIGRARPVGNVVHAVKLATVTVYEHRAVRRVFKIFSLVLLAITGYVLITWKITSMLPALVREKPSAVSEIDSNIFSFTADKASIKQNIVNSPLASTGCGTKISIKTRTSTIVSLVSGSKQRVYRIYLPKNFNNTFAHPLILDFHGYAANAYREEVISKFDPIADKNSIIMVYPQGTTDEAGLAGWNTGLHPSIKSNDVLFVSNILNQLQQHLCVDPNRIFATGFSNGGGFVNELACTLSNRIAAFAPVSGSYIISEKKCAYSRPLSIIEFHGTLDTIVPYNGNKKRRELSVSSWVKNLAKQSDCKKNPEIIYNTKKVIGYSFQNCGLDASIVHYKILGERHIWPLVLFKATDGQEQFQSAASIIWSFFKDHPLRQRTKVSGIS